VPKWVRATDDFAGTGVGEVGFRKGGRVLVIDDSDAGWWMGMVDLGMGSVGPIGTFPASLVEVEGESEGEFEKKKEEEEDVVVAVTA
jgi:hypothetical protein